MSLVSEVFASVPKCEENLVAERKAELDVLNILIDSYVQNTIASMAEGIAKSRQDHPKKKWVAIPIRDEDNNIVPMVGYKEMAKQVVEKIKEQGFEAKLSGKIKFGHLGLCPAMTYHVNIRDKG